MFKKESNMNNEIDSLVSNGMDIKGDINSKSSLRVDGKIEGNMNIEGDLIVGKEGFVKGVIQAKNIMMAGRFEGNINAANKVVVNNTGILHGDVQCQLIVIEEGGILDGNCKMQNKLGLVTGSEKKTNKTEFNKK